MMAQKGFNNVIDAFHVINNGMILINFFEKSYNRATKHIILTDDLFGLSEVPFFNNFQNEVNARWNLVETAWCIT